MLIYIEFSRCQESGVTYLNSKVEKIIESNDGHSVVACEGELMVPCRYILKKIK